MALDAGKLSQLRLLPMKTAPVAKALPVRCWQDRQWQMARTLGAVIFPAFNDTLIFLLMIIVLLIRPSGLFGNPAAAK